MCEGTAGTGAPWGGDRERWGLPGAAGQDLAAHPIPPPIQEQGSWGALGLVGVGDQQCCSIAGAGADDPREDEMGSWAVGRVEGGPGEGARSQMITAGVS